ncbi:MAG: ankyrin repeat domain-containing protein [Verrucomicrobia bacterium]|nr:ankyrin repeat domain-containing protein [Verrucomicrobiota bacterium]
MANPEAISSWIRGQLDQSDEVLADPGVQAIRACNVKSFRKKVPDRKALRTFGPTHLSYLHLAALQGCTEVMEYVVSLGLSVDEWDAFQQTTPLMLALIAGQDDAALWLLDHGANPSLRLAGGLSPIHFATMFSSTSVMNKLLVLGVDPNTSSRDGVTPVVLAAGVGNTDKLFWLLDHGVGVNDQARGGPTALQAASGADHPDAVLALLERGADPELYGRSIPMPPLMLAALSGGLRSAVILLDQGAMVNAVSDRGFTAISHAVQRGDLDMTELLAEHGADLSVTDNWGRTLLHLATYGDNPDLITWILDQGLDINTVSSQGASPLLFAVQEQSTNAFLALLAAGADPSLSTKKGDCPLMNATRRDLFFVQELLKAGADVNVFDAYGWTLLRHAIRAGSLEMIQMLLEHGAEPNRYKKDRWPLALAAAHHGDVEIMQALLNHGLDVDVRDLEGQTALMAAARNGDEKMISFLLDAGAAPGIRDTRGLTAWHLASLSGQFQIATMLAKSMTEDQLSPTQKVKVYFDLDAPLASNVSVVGSFNGWVSDADKMTRRADDGWWYVELEVYPLAYVYKFVVDNNWIPDPLSREYRIDPYEETKNSFFRAEDRLVGTRPERPASTASSLYPVTFTYQNRKARSVALVGEFNGWNTDANLMKLVKVGRWETTVNLPEGDYAYKFHVDGEWLVDPTNEWTKVLERVTNSLIQVSAPVVDGPDAAGSGTESPGP